MDKCPICNNNVNDPITLRTGQKVCSVCIDALQKNLDNSKVEIKNSEEVIQDHDLMIYFIVFVIIVFSITMTVIYYLLHIGLIVCASIFIIGLLFSLLKIYDLKRKVANLNKNIETLKSNRTIIKSKLVPIYDQFYEIPPDWYDRRKRVIERDGDRCAKCGRAHRLSTGYASKVPFHLHHIVPKATVEGSHKLENLELLCEICHGKKKATGHNMVAQGRKNRLIRRRKYQNRNKLNL